VGGVISVGPVPLAKSAGAIEEILLFCCRANGPAPLRLVSSYVGPCVRFLAARFDWPLPARSGRHARRARRPIGARPLAAIRWPETGLPGRIQRQRHAPGLVIMSPAMLLR
jgi:hypothetical protein